MRTTDSNHLFERSFKSSAEYHGDAQPKKDAANAKRVATALKTAASNYRFENLLEPEQLLALRAATNVMSNLACVLDEVCGLSKRHFKKCESARQLKAAQQKAEREAVLDTAASRRWSDDIEMKGEAEDLQNFLGDCSRLVSVWLDQRRGTAGAHMLTPDVDVGDGRDGASGLGGLLAAFKSEPTPITLRSLRRYAAATVDGLVTETRPSYRYSGQDWHFPRLADFEAWRAEQVDRRRSVALAIGSAT
ncbi:MAG: hypothetical protein ABI702_06115 [Burkholderiales bacterium]